MFDQDLHQEIVRYLVAYNYRVSYLRSEGETLEEMWERVWHTELDNASLRAAVLLKA